LLKNNFLNLMKNEVSQLLYNQIRFFIKMSPKSNQKNFN
jgi:hypothetical protein